MSDGLMDLILQENPISREELWRDIELFMRLKIDMQGRPTTKRDFESQLNELVETNRIRIEGNTIHVNFQKLIPEQKPKQASLF